MSPLQHVLGRRRIANARRVGAIVLAQSRLLSIRDRLLDAALGTILEILDNDPPQWRPVQAWSVACVLETWVKLERVRHTAKA